MVRNPSHRRLTLTTIHTERGSQPNRMTVLIDRMISLANLTLHYRETREEEASPLILLHGLGAEAQDWDEIALALVERYHVFALSQRGHGKSDRPGVYSFELMRDDLKAFADALSLDRFTLIGHSMGATVAYLFAERWPDRVVRLVSEDTPPPYEGRANPYDDPPDDPEEPVPFAWHLVKPMIRQLTTP